MCDAPCPVVAYRNLKIALIASPPPGLLISAAKTADVALKKKKEKENKDNLHDAKGHLYKMISFM